MNKLISNWREDNKQFQSNNYLSNSAQYLILALIIGAILVIRLITITVPALDWTVWKEIDYLYISHNFFQNGFNLFWPEISWPAELPHVTEMELPLVPYITAVLYKLFGYQVYTARAVILIASIITIIYVFKLTKRELGAFTGLLAALAAGIMPLYHPYGHFLFTEPLMISMSVVSLYYTAEWVDNERRRDGLLAIIALSLTFALKLESLYLLLPVEWIAFRKYGFRYSEYKRFIFLILISLIVPILWYAYASYLEKIGAHLFGIFSGHDKSQIFSMLIDFRWYRTMAGRVINGILGGLIGFVLFIVGLFGAIVTRKAGLFFAYLLSIGIYFILVAEGQIDAPYRQMTMIPAASVFVGLGVEFILVTLISLIKWFKKSYQYTQGQFKYVLAAGLFIVFLLPIQKYNNIFIKDEPGHWDRWQIAQEIKKVANTNSKLIAIGEYSKHVGGYDLSPVIYYYTGLQGWTLTSDSWSLENVQKLRDKGAAFLVSVLPFGYPYDFIYLPDESNEVFLEQMRSTYPIIFEDQGQLIFDLR